MPNSIVVLAEILLSILELETVLTKVKAKNCVFIGRRNGAFCYVIIFLYFSMSFVLFHPCPNPSVTTTNIIFGLKIN